MFSDTGCHRCNSKTIQLTEQNIIYTFVHISVSGLHCRISLTIVAFPFSTAQYNAVLLSYVKKENQVRDSIKNLLFVNIERWEVISIYMTPRIYFWETRYKMVQERLSTTEVRSVSHRAAKLGSALFLCCGGGAQDHSPETHLYDAIRFQERKQVRGHQHLNSALLNKSLLNMLTQAIAYVCPPLLNGE